MARLRVGLLITLLTALVTTSPVFAGKIKLATLAPDGSPWHKLLEEMGAEWQEKTDGRVRLVIYPGGVAGSDADMVRKIRIRQLQGGALTVNGLASIDPAFNIFSVPLFFDSFEEYAYVLEKMTPVLAERLEAKGFVLLHWGHGGWIHIFSKKPIRTVDDLKDIKIFTTAGDNPMIRVWKDNGFHPVALATTDVLTGLQTGMIEGMPVPPLGALAMQWYKQTPYMLDAGVAPLIGATVIAKGTWSGISEADRAAMLEAGSRVQERLAVEIPEKDAASVIEMTKRGLNVVPIDENDAAAWETLAGSLADTMRTTMVPSEIFDLASRYRTEYRESEN
ncbi:MAG: TRAP transporter substrate-binding protein DctP [Acidobacteriota bacterium]|nr:TRAP transporter substrate-binding protein DctP [Acidobacteriota bacterium]